MTIFLSIFFILFVHLTAMQMKAVALWDMKPHRLADSSIFYAAE
jgi:hypothetical protein